MKGFWILGALLSLSFAASAMEGESRAAAEAPLKHYGALIAIGNPYPSLIGLNGAYNINENLRASVGYGEIEVTSSLAFTSSGIMEEKIKAQTYSAGMDYLFLDTAVRPVAGLRAGYFSVSGKGEFSVQGISKSTGLLYANLGLDWTARSGFNLGTGFNVAMAGGKGANFYANLGYFF